MITNERILAEIQARKQKGFLKAAEIEMPGPLMPALAQIQKRVDPALIDTMAAELLPNFSFADEGQQIQFQGFEWYYDGSAFPDTLGYYGANVEPLPDASKVPEGSNTHEARADFEIGSELSHYICTDCGYIDVNLVLGPLYDVTCREGKNYVDLMDGNEDALDLMESLYVLRLFEVIHLSMRKLVEAGSIDYTNMKKPFCVFANNHDWSPFLVYVIDPSG